MFCDIANNLGDDDLRRIQSLEKALGLTIVAFSCRSLDPAREERLRAMSDQLGLTPRVEPADANDAQLARLRAAEEELGLSLIAVKS